jgi:hypothetical protein
VRSVTVPLILISAFAVCGSALANEVSMHKHTAEEIKAVCDKVGGKFSQDAGGYGCGTTCNGGPGTDCIVNCKTDQPCYAQVIGSRRPTTPLDALQAPARRTR